MGAFYDKLQGCVETDAGIDCADARATPLARMVFEVYGGPYYNAETCPAGSEPPQPSLILEALEKGGLPLDLMFTSEEKADFDRFATEEYEKAHAAWTKRIQMCGDDPGDDGPPPKGKSMDADSLGALALVVVGFLLILRARKR